MPITDALIERAKALAKMCGAPKSYSMEGPVSENAETWSICHDAPDGHYCFATVVGNSIDQARITAERIEEALAIVWELAQADDAVDPHAAK